MEMELIGSMPIGPIPCETYDWEPDDSEPAIGQLAVRTDIARLSVAPTRSFLNLFGDGGVHLLRRSGHPIFWGQRRQSVLTMMVAGLFLVCAFVPEFRGG